MASMLKHYSADVLREWLASETSDPAMVAMVRDELQARDRQAAIQALLDAPPPVGCGMRSENVMVVARTSREDR